MIRIVYSLMTVALILMFVVTGCTNRSDSRSGVWNSETSTFTTEDEKLCYILPTDVSLWAIADAKNLPSDMLFFGVDSSEGVALGIFRPVVSAMVSEKGKSFSDNNIEEILRQLSNPQHGQTVVYEQIDKSRSIFDENDAWSFTIEHKILDNTSSLDTVTVYYSGYIFDGLNHPYGIVLISNINPNDSIGRNQLMKYTSGLSFK